MGRQLTSFLLMVCGVLALSAGLSIAPAPATVAAAPALQPSPRPTLVPTADIVVHEDDGPKAVAFGRLTGTVIDVRTGAPSSDRLVLVDGTPVFSDANGNYDHWVAAGNHSVVLQLSADEGVAEAGPQAVAVAPDAATVLHLFFRSAEPAASAQPTLEPTLEPTALPLTATPAPVEPTVEPAAQPETMLPSAEAVGPAIGASVPAAGPTQLPETAFGGLQVSGAFVGMGLALFVLGALLQLRPRRHPASASADQQMLRRLLATPTRDEQNEA